MAVTKAQLAVWALISGLSVWGYSMLSRVKLPDTVAAPVESVLSATVESPAAAAPKNPVARVAKVLPATVPVFPFPDDLIPEATGEVASEENAAAGSFAGIASAGVPELSDISEGEMALGDADVVAAVAEPEPEAATEPVQMAEVPPVPMPARPIVAHPVKAVPLSEVKTLYVVADALNVRAAPSTSGPVLQKLPQGFAVAAREQANEWIGFLMRDGSTGWMRTDYLSDTMPPARPTVPTGGEPLNLMM